MLKYLAFNAGWFLFIFFLPFLGGRLWRLAVLMLIITTGVFVAATKVIDPFSWFYYALFSLLIFWGSHQFRRWAFARSIVLEDELAIFSKRLVVERETLREKTRDAQAEEEKASEIYHIYDKVKEMSQSLDMRETFLVFGEALAKYFEFHTIKLALFNEDEPQPQHPDEVYELHHKDFQGVFDRSVYLKEPKKLKGELFPFDQKIYEMVFKSQEPIRTVEPAGGGRDENIRLWPDFMPFIAQPIFIHKKIFGVLVLLGVEKAAMPVLSILTERFISEAQRVKLYGKVETLAITDGLTRVYVRRHLVERLEGELDRSKRFGLKLSFLMIDIDYFKDFNDHYGHLVGDVVLKQVAETIKTNVREIDLVGRYGGEEFGVLLIETDESGAFFVAERIRRAISEKTFKAYDENLKVTISVGCAACSPKLDDVNLIVEAADSALYQAKRQGRNRVCLSALSEDKA